MFSSDLMYVLIFYTILRIAIIIGVCFLLFKLFLSHKKKQTLESLQSGQAFSFSKEHGLSQVFFLLFLCFFGIALFKINNDSGLLFSWQSIVFILVFTAFLLTYLFKNILTLILGLIGSIVWWIGASREWVYAKTEGGDIQTLVFLVGAMFIILLYYIGGTLHKIDKKFARFAYIYRAFGMFPIIAALFYFSTRVGSSTLESLSVGLPFYSSWQISAFFAFFIFSIIVSVMYSHSRKAISLFESAGIFELVLFFFSLLFIPYSAYSSYSAFSGFPPVIFSVILFLNLIGMIGIGYEKKDIWHINFGVLFLFIFIIVKYFDWFYSFFDKSLFFISAGIFLFILGWFMEKGRKYMVERITHKNN